MRYLVFRKNINFFFKSNFKDFKNFKILSNKYMFVCYEKINSDEKD